MDQLPARLPRATPAGRRLGRLGPPPAGDRPRGYYDARKREGWDAKRLRPSWRGSTSSCPGSPVAPRIDPEFGETAGQSFQTLLEKDAHELGLTLDDIRNWQPPAKGGKRKAKG